MCVEWRVSGTRDGWKRDLLVSGDGLDLGGKGLNSLG